MTTITSISIEGLPLHDSVSENIYDALLKIVPSQSADQDICCINGLFGYKAGIFGRLASWLSVKNTFGNSRLISKNIFKKLKARDHEIITFGLSLIFRMIPLLGIVAWDPKRYLYNRTNYPYMVRNRSIPSHFNLMSTLFLQPLFDSGTAIFSKLPCIDSGFVPWVINKQLHWKQRLFNRGINWALFKAQKHQLVFNIDVVPNVHLLDIQYSQLMNVINKQIDKLWLIELEVYICGNFGLPMRFACILPKVSELKTLYFDNNQFELQESSFTNIKQTNFVFRKIEKQVNLTRTILPWENKNIKAPIAFTGIIPMEVEEQKESERPPTPLPIIDENFNTIEKDDYKIEIKSEYFIPNEEIIHDHNSDNHTDEEWITI